MFKLAITDEVEVPINFTTTNKGRPATFKFKLICPRMTTEEINASIAKDPQRPIGEVVREQVTGWVDQRLVLGEDDQPAPFSQEALAVMFSIPGFGDLAWLSYRHEVGARGKN